MKGGLRKHTLNLREGDWDYLTSVLRPQDVDTSVFIRRLVSQTVDTYRHAQTPLPKEPLDV